MTMLEDLPLELLKNIFGHLDPKSLARVRRTSRLLNHCAFDAILWKQVTLKKEYQHLEMCHSKPQSIFLQALWHTLKVEYYAQHPLYETMKMLNLFMEKEPSEKNKAISLYSKASKGGKKDRINTIKAIILSKQSNEWLLKYQLSKWLKLLTTGIILTIPEYVPQLLNNFASQKNILLQDISNLELRDMLKLSDEGAVYFFTACTLGKWRQHLFSKEPCEFYSLEELLIEIAAKHPKIIPQILEDNGYQASLLSGPYRDQPLCELLQYSEDGPMLLVKNEALAPLKEMVLSCFLQQTAEKTDNHFNPVWLKGLIQEHPQAYQFILQYPESFRLFNLQEVKSFIKKYPEIFRLSPHQLEYQLFITTYQNNLQIKYNDLSNPCLLPDKNKLLDPFSTTATEWEKSVSIRPRFTECI